MSRAFVKEADGDDVVDDIPERIHSDLPNYITQQGLDALHRAVVNLEKELNNIASLEAVDSKSRKQTISRDLSFYRERIARAIPVDVPDIAPRIVRFGVTVTLIDENDNNFIFTIVGEDETDVEHGRISWASPLAKLLINKEVGDEILWPRGDNVLPVEITDISV